MFIENGWGDSGSKLRINSRGQGFTLSESLQGEEAAAERGESFIIECPTVTSAATSGGLVSIYNNEQGTVFKVTRMFITTGTLTDTNLFVTQLRNPPSISGGVTTNGKVVQKNVTSPLDFGLIVTSSEPGTALTVADAETYRYHDWAVSSHRNEPLDMAGTNVFGFGNRLVFGFRIGDAFGQGAAAATANQYINIRVNVVKGFI